MIGPEQPLKAQVSYMKKCPTCLWSPLLLHTAFSLPTCTYGLVRNSL